MTTQSKSQPSFVAFRPVSAPGIAQAPRWPARLLLGVITLWIAAEIAVVLLRIAGRF